MGKTTTSTATTDETAEPSPKVVQQLDPRTLLLDRNIRSGDRLDKDLVDSVRQLGVLVTIDAVSTADGGVRVLRGHGRTRAAIEAQRETVPVIIHGVEGTTDAAEVERIIGQHAENAHRTDLTHGEQVAVVDQLTAFGVSAAQIVKRTRIKRDQVDAALAVGRSELATNAVERYSFLDLTQAATLAEFEDDEETVTALVAAAKTGRFDHVAQRARDNRDRAQRRAAHAEALTAQGITVVTGGEVGRPLYALRTADGEHITPDTHTACPGHAAQVTMTWGYLEPRHRLPHPPGRRHRHRRRRGRRRAPGRRAQLVHRRPRPGDRLRPAPRHRVGVHRPGRERPRRRLRHRQRQRAAEAFRDGPGPGRSRARRAARRTRVQRRLGFRADGAPVVVARHPLCPARPRPQARPRSSRRPSRSTHLCSATTAATRSSPSYWASSTTAPGPRSPRWPLRPATSAPRSSP